MANKNAIMKKLFGTTNDLGTKKELGVNNMSRKDGAPGIVPFKPRKINNNISRLKRY